MEILDNVLDTLGNAPLVRLGRRFAGSATLLPDSGERQLSKLNTAWLRQHGLQR